jgi:hypothetical protein
VSYVVSFGSASLDGVWGLIEAFTRGQSVEWVRTLSSSSCDSFEYQETKDSLDEIRESLAAEEVVSIQFNQTESEKMLLGLYAPRFCGGNLRQWLCVVEGSETSAVRWFDRCLGGASVEFVALCLDEYPDYEMDLVTANTFPWDDWRVVRAAARRPDGTWEERSKKPT